MNCSVCGKGCSDLVSADFSVHPVGTKKSAKHIRILITRQFISMFHVIYCVKMYKEKYLNWKIIPGHLTVSQHAGGTPLFSAIQFHNNMTVKLILCKITLLVTSHNRLTSTS
jgi:hypothetical protein